MELKKIFELDGERTLEISVGSRIITSQFNEKSHKKIQSKYIIKVLEPVNAIELTNVITRAVNDFQKLWNKKTRRPHSLFIMLLLIELADEIGQRLYKLDVKINFIDRKGKMKEINVNSYLKQCYRYKKYVMQMKNKQKEKEEEEKKKD